MNNDPQEFIEQQSRLDAKDRTRELSRFAEWEPTGNETEPGFDLVEIGEGVFQVEKRSDAHSLA